MATGTQVETASVSGCSKAHERASRQVRLEEWVCWICGEPCETGGSVDRRPHHSESQGRGGCAGEHESSTSVM